MKSVKWNKNKTIILAASAFVLGGIVTRFLPSSHAILSKEVGTKNTISMTVTKNLAGTTIHNLSGLTFKVSEGTPDYKVATSEEGVYMMDDDDGTSYFFRGNSSNNYVSFAGKTWRVIRVNGDGTVRIVLNGTTGTDSQFNPSYTDNANAFYMYGTVGASSYDASTKNTNSSSIKQAVDSWYQSNLANYSKYISTNAGFCGDRSRSGSYYGYSNLTTYYDGYTRTVFSEPSLKCRQSNDLYTVTSSNKGNKALTYPIGLMTADEVILAGSSGGIFDGAANYTKGANNYANIGTNYWTMTPCGGYVPYGPFAWGADVFFVDGGGALDDRGAAFSVEVRPVVNLTSDAITGGTGTSSDPYTVG